MQNHDRLSEDCLSLSKQGEVTRKKELLRKRRKQLVSSKPTDCQNGQWSDAWVYLLPTSKVPPYQERPEDQVSKEVALLLFFGIRNWEFDEQI
jgi:hypothetical protein